MQNRYLYNTYFNFLSELEIFLKTLCKLTTVSQMRAYLKKCNLTNINQLAPRRTKRETTRNFSHNVDKKDRTVIVSR